jgi:hypothetical protein
MSNAISPSHLSNESKRRYRSYTSTYDLSGPQLALLQQALEQADVASEAMRVVSEQGQTYVTPAGTVKARPEVAIQRQALALSARLMAQIDLAHAKLRDESGSLRAELSRRRGMHE